MGYLSTQLGVILASGKTCFIQDMAVSRSWPPPSQFRDWFERNSLCWLRVLMSNYCYNDIIISDHHTFREDKTHVGNDKARGTHILLIKDRYGE